MKLPCPALSAGGDSLPGCGCVGQMAVKSLPFVSLVCPFDCAPNENYPSAECAVGSPGSGQRAGTVSQCVWSVEHLSVSEGREGA